VPSATCRSQGGGGLGGLMRGPGEVGFKWLVRLGPVMSPLVGAPPEPSVGVTGPAQTWWTERKVVVDRKPGLEAKEDLLELSKDTGRPRSSRDRGKLGLRKGDMTAVARANRFLRKFSPGWTKKRFGALECRGRHSGLGLVGAWRNPVPAVATGARRFQFRGGERIPATTGLLRVMEASRFGFQFDRKPGLLTVLQYGTVGL